MATSDLAAFETLGGELLLLVLLLLSMLDVEEFPTVAPASTSEAELSGSCFSGLVFFEPAEASPFLLSFAPSDLAEPVLVVDMAVVGVSSAMSSHESKVALLSLVVVVTSVLTLVVAVAGSSGGLVL